jgi:hypothetical protein
MKMSIIFSKCNNTNKLYGNPTQVMTHTGYAPFASPFVDYALESFCLQDLTIASKKLFFTLLLQTKTSFTYFLLNIL